MITEQLLLALLHCAAELHLPIALEQARHQWFTRHHIVQQCSCCHAAQADTRQHQQAVAEAGKQLRPLHMVTAKLPKEVACRSASPRHRPAVLKVGTKLIVSFASDQRSDCQQVS